MAKKKSPEQNGPKKVDNPNVLGLQAQVLEQPITQTLEVNYMPYAMSVIVSRAIPEIDGFKPSHRKLLYTMYEMHLLGGSRTYLRYLGAPEPRLRRSAPSPGGLQREFRQGLFP